MLSHTDVLEKNQKLFDAAHRMFSNPNGDDNDKIEKMYVNPNFRRPEGITHLIGELPPLSPKRLMQSRLHDDVKTTSYDAKKVTSPYDAKKVTTSPYDAKTASYDIKTSSYNGKMIPYNGKMTAYESRHVKVDVADDDDEGYPATLNVEMSRSTRNVVPDSSSNRDISDPMSLDSGVITTLSRFNHDSTKIHLTQTAVAEGCSAKISTFQISEATQLSVAAPFIKHTSCQ